LSSASPLMCEPLARQVQASNAHATSAEPTVRVPSLPEHEQVGWWCRRQGLRWRRGRRRWRRLWRPRKRWCRRRRPVVSKRLVLVLPAEDLRGRQLHISTAELPGCCRARLPRCAPARHRAACRFGHSSLRDLRVLKEGWVSSRLLCGQLLCSRYVAGCSVASCSVAGCSVVMRPKCGWWVQGRCESGWAASRTCIVSQLEIRCRGLCGRSSCSDGRILRTLAACALRAASWLPAFTSAHSAPLSSKVPSRP